MNTGFRTLEAAFRHFFRRCKTADTQKGSPRYKSRKHSRTSFRMDGGRVKLEGPWLKLDKLDAPTNMAEVLRVAVQIKSVPMSEDGGTWVCRCQCIGGTTKTRAFAGVG